jgi:AraC-like DNA-binding protein
MRVQNIIPSQKIAEYVDRILVIEHDIVLRPFILPLYANGVPTLLFKSKKGKLGDSDSNHLTLFGQTISPESLTLTENFVLIACFFKPHALISLFGIAAIELTDKPIDLNLLSPEKTLILQEALLNSQSIEHMILLLDNYIFDLVSASKKISQNIVYASQKIVTHYSKESLLNIQRELNISEKTFQRLFEKYMGLSPNTYRRICQFNSAFTDLNSGRFNNLSDIAYNHGYADQSHYVRVFREFTGIPPGEYLNYGTN